MCATRPLILAAALAMLAGLAACEDPPPGSVVTTSAAGAVSVSAAATPGPAFKLAGSVRTIATGTIAVAPRPTDAAGNTPPLTLVSYEQPLGDTDVVVLDAGFKQLTQVPKLKTDAGGRFELAGLPAGRTFVLEARPAGGGRILRGLVSTVPGGELPLISPATSIACAMLLAELKDIPPGCDPQALARLVHEIGLNTTPDEFEQYRDDRWLTAKVGAIAAAKGEVWDALVKVRSALQGPAVAVAALGFDLTAR